MFNVSFGTMDINARVISGSDPGAVPGDYGHKRARNKRIGPGGGTRQLHQTIGG